MLLPLSLVEVDGVSGDDLVQLAGLCQGSECLHVGLDCGGDGGMTLTSQYIIPIMTLHHGEYPYIHDIIFIKQQEYTFYSFENLVQNNVIIHKLFQRPQ